MHVLSHQGSVAALRPGALAGLISLLALCSLPVAAAAQAMDGGSNEALLRSALRAAPLSVIDGATVADGSGNVLREGTNGWVCMPDDPDMPGDSPMCIDARWQKVMKAFMAGEKNPQYSGVGISYMLRGDFPVSNTDPHATGPTADNEWIEDSGPHVMILVSDHALLEGLPTKPGKGPWVMWRGTPYAHIMIPVPGNPAH